MPEPNAALVACHFRFGWWTLALYLTLGLVLESLHGFKVGWFLDADQEARRMMLRLAHAHGTLTALVNICFAATVALGRANASRSVSRALLSGSILLPGGFFLGALGTYGSDPGVGVLLVPLGAILLIGAVVGIACRMDLRVRP
jgi:hypothetical protein